MDLNEYVKFDDSCKQFEIITGTQGKYSYDDVIRVSVLNEKAKYKGKGIPFTAVLPGGPLPSGLLQDPYLYVGVKIVLKNETVLAIYVSKEKTMVNTDQYIQDRKIAKKIEEMIKNVCEISWWRKRLEVNGGASCLYNDIQKLSIQNEDANFKDKTKPFTHTILGGATFMAGAVEPMMYVGIKVVLKDNSVLPIYVSKEKVLFNSDKYLNDVKEANEILKELEKRLHV